MSSYDAVRMTLPDGTEFVGRGGLNVTESHTPQWLFGGGYADALAASKRITGSEGDLTEQVFLGTGAKVRTFNVTFDQWEGSTDNWGSANAGDDVLTKLNVLGHALATTPIDSGTPATLEFGEYSSPGQFSPIDVVPGEVSLRAEFGEGGSPSAFRPELNWIDALDIEQALHDVKSAGESFF